MVMESQNENRWEGTEEREGEGSARFYEIPATMPCPEYGESVPVSSVQFVD
jgi:hypothetical protein